MNSFFFALLACFSVVNARVYLAESTLNRTAESARQKLEKHDPLSKSDVSLSLLEDTLKLKFETVSASGFSNWAITSITKEKPNDAAGIISAPSITLEGSNIIAELTSLNINAFISSISGFVSGLTIETDIQYTKSPLQVTSIKALAQIEDINLQLKATIDDSTLDLSLDSSNVDNVNALAIEYQEQASEYLLVVVNSLLSLIDSA